MARDTDHTMALAAETLRDGKSVLIFCGTKRVRCMGLLPTGFGSSRQKVHQRLLSNCACLPQLVEGPSVSPPACRLGVI